MCYILNDRSNKKNNNNLSHLMAMLRFFTASVVNIGRVAADSEFKAPSDTPRLRLIVLGI